MANLMTSTGASLAGVGQRIMEALRLRKKKPKPAIAKPIAPKEKYGEAFMKGLQARKKAIQELK
jgi:hypothetical protein